MFNPATNQMSTASYDAAGNQLTFGSHTLAYDAENRQTSATDSPSYGGGQAIYVYDGDGRRVEKIIGSQTTTHVYDIFGKLAAEYSNLAPPAPPCTTCYLSWDHLGSTRLVTDPSANITSRHDFIPFGEEIPANTAGRRSEWGPQPDNVNQKFTSKDSETGLDYVGASAFNRWCPDRGEKYL